MGFVVSWWERRDGADREEFGDAAQAWCQAARAQSGVVRAHFYWVDTETVVIVTEVDSFEAFDRSIGSDRSDAALRLGDVARPRHTERWTLPLRGEHDHHVSCPAVSLREALDLP